MFKPILLITEVFHWQSKQPGLYKRVIDTVAEYGFYRGVETFPVEDAAERKTLRSLCEANDYTLLQWLTKTLLDRNLSLSSLDDNERAEAVQCVVEAADMAYDAGAFGIAVISGAAPDKERQAAALAAFRESAKNIAACLEKKGMTFIIEALDREQHKKQVLGPTPEAVTLIGELRAINPKTGLCWDSAHIALMGEDLSESLAMSAGSAYQAHLANAVLDPASYYYGDHHFAPGSELGFLTLEKIVETLGQITRSGAGGENGIARVGVESRTLPGNDPWRNEKHCRELLASALDMLKREQAH